MQDSIELKDTLSNEQKVNILLQALEERYKSVHVIRDRVQSTCLWILGLFVTAAGWLIQSNHDLTILEKIFVTIIILFTITLVRFFYLHDLQKGFKTQQQIQAKIESALGLCRDNIFITGSIYPETWSNAGTNKGNGKFFFHNYLLIYFGTVSLLVAIWLNSPATLKKETQTTKVFIKK